MGEVKKIRLIGARRYIQGYPPWQPKVEKYPIVFEYEDAVMPLAKYEEDENFKNTFENFPCEIIEE